MGKEMRRATTVRINTTRGNCGKPRISLALFAVGTALSLIGCTCEKPEEKKKERAVVMLKESLRRIPEYPKGGEIKAKPEVLVGCKILKKKAETVKKKRIKEGKTVVISMSENEVGGSFKIEKITKQGVFFQVCIPSKNVDGMLLVRKGEKRQIDGFGISVHDLNRKKKTVVLSVTPMTIIADANGTGKKTEK